MIQAKGIDYSLEDLLESSCYLPNFAEGKYIVIYLSPRDYHRIHSPHEGRIMGYSYTPGKLFSVNELSVRGLAGLFPKNERLTTYIETAGNGMVGLVKVGAVNVGRIRVNYDTIHTNRWIRIASHRVYAEPFPIGRGDELGRFEMGSTVILLFEKGRMEFDPPIAEGRAVRFGERIGHFQSLQGSKNSKVSSKKRTGKRKGSI
jgi:phosphatidylserine decarboxylase